MRSTNRWLALVAILVALPLSGCGKESAAQQKHHPATVEHTEGSEIARVTLTEKAIERLDLQTAAVGEEKISRSETPQKVVPYSAVLYDPHGKTWVYVSPDARVFERQSIDVEYIEGDQAVLKEGPDIGSQVVTVGVAELYGAEYGVGH